MFQAHIPLRLGKHFHFDLHNTTTTPLGYHYYEDDDDDDDQALNKKRPAMAEGLPKAQPRRDDCREPTRSTKTTTTIATGWPTSRGKWSLR